MDKDIKKQYEGALEKGVRCQDWLNLETTQEFLQPLKDKLEELKNISFEDIVSMEDKSFRSKIEASFLAAKEIEDYFNLLDSIVYSQKEADDALNGNNVETY